MLISQILCSLDYYMACGKVQIWSYSYLDVLTFYKFAITNNFDCKVIASQKSLICCNSHMFLNFLTWCNSHTYIIVIGSPSLLEFFYLLEFPYLFGILPLTLEFPHLLELFHLLELPNCWNSLDFGILLTCWIVSSSLLEFPHLLQWPHFVQIPHFLRYSLTS